MRIEPIGLVGKHRPLCSRTIRIAESLVTHEARRQRFKRQQAGVPMDQCMNRADFIVDDKPTCRTHASWSALEHVLSGGAA